MARTATLLQKGFTWAFKLLQNASSPTRQCLGQRPTNAQANSIADDGRGLIHNRTGGSDVELSEDHSKWLHQALKMQNHEVLPEKLVEKYWELKRIFDRTGTRLTQHEVTTAAWLLGYEEPIDALTPPLASQ